MFRILECNNHALVFTIDNALTSKSIWFLSYTFEVVLQRILQDPVPKLCMNSERFKTAFERTKKIYSLQQPFSIHLHMYTILQELLIQFIVLTTNINQKIVSRISKNQKNSNSIEHAIQGRLENKTISKKQGEVLIMKWSSVQC